MNTVEIVQRNLPNFEGVAHLVRVTGSDYKRRYFIISSIHNEHAMETLVFPACKHGEVTDWCEVWGRKAGSRRSQREREAIAFLEGWSECNCS